ncbi:MAG: transcription termination factor NusA [bacterium]|nr:transcription termination factor NusA [bacterium]
MNGEFREALEILERDKGIDRDTLIKTICDALYSGYKKSFGSSQNVEIKVDDETLDIKVFVVKKVVKKVEDERSQISLDEAKAFKNDIEPEEKISIEITPKEFGRIAAQTAKQVIIQRIRETERELVYNEYKARVGQVINGQVTRMDDQNAFINLGKVEGILPRREIPSRERLNLGDRIKVYVLSVKKSSKGPQIVLSRTYPDLVRRLFELEVPEIYEGLVKIKGVARDPGYRTKIAVSSTDSKIDSVGTCVGVKGTRVQAVIKELNGEKIDIVQYSDDISIFIKNALNPAKVIEIIVNEKEKQATVIVPDKQLSLAIGRSGQNVKLAAKLTGWKIDINSESQRKDERLKAEKAPFGKVTALSMLPGVGKKLEEKLKAQGFSSIEDISKTTLENLMEIPGIGEEKGKRILDGAKQMLKDKR